MHICVHELYAWISNSACPHCWHAIVILPHPLSLIEMEFVVLSNEISTLAKELLCGSPVSNASSAFSISSIMAVMWSAGANTHAHTHAHTHTHRQTDTQTDTQMHIAFQVLDIVCIDILYIGGIVGLSMTGDASSHYRLSRRAMSTCTWIFIPHLRAYACMYTYEVLVRQSRRVHYS